MQSLTSPLLKHLSMCQKTQGLMFQIGLSSYFAKTMKQVFPEPPDGRIIVFTGTQIKRVIQITSEKCVGAMVGCVILNFGKHKGRTYHAIFLEDPDYCRWVVQCITHNEKRFRPEMIQFGRWLQDKG